MDYKTKVAPSVDTPTLPGPSSVPSKIRFKKWEAVSVSANPRCPICFNDLKKKCSNCNPEQTCPLVEGACKGESKHVFHEHCMRTWFEKLNNKPEICPLDRQLWKVQRFYCN